jgi:hypothetical protein
VEQASVCWRYEHYNIKILYCLYKILMLQNVIWQIGACWIICVGIDIVLSKATLIKRLDLIWKVLQKTFKISKFVFPLRA